MSKTFPTWQDSEVPIPEGADPALGAALTTIKRRLSELGASESAPIIQGGLKKYNAKSLMELPMEAAFKLAEYLGTVDTANELYGLKPASELPTPPKPPTAPAMPEPPAVDLPDALDRISVLQKTVGKRLSKVRLNKDRMIDDQVLDFLQALEMIERIASEL